MEWFRRDGARYLLEKQLLKRHYPEARFVIRDGLLEVFIKHRGRRGEYLVKVVYPRDFPWRVPEAHIVKPSIWVERHMFSRGRPCLHDGSNVGPQTSGKVICDWALGWIKAYELWLDGGRQDFPSLKEIQKIGV